MDLKFSCLLLLSIFILLLDTKVASQPCVPTSGHTALVIGQDYFSITNYTSKMGVPNPFGFMSYTALNSTTGSLTGLKYPIDYGSGTEWVHGLLNKYPESAIQLGLYLVNVFDYVLSGSLDDIIDNLITYIKEVNVSVYLRIGYEFDSYSNGYPTEKFKEMFIYIVNRFRSQHTQNVAFVWHAASFATRDNIPVYEWYPGDEYVDWCGISLFQQPYECMEDFLCGLQYADALISYCHIHNKPVMIAESTPFGGIVDTTLQNVNPETKNEAGFVGDSWHRWYENVLNYIEQRDIRMWSYINCDWDSQPMWQLNHAPGKKWGDSRLEKYNGIQAKWISKVLRNKRFSWVDDKEERNKVCIERRITNDNTINDEGAFVHFLAIGVFVLCLILVTLLVHIISTCYRSSHHSYSRVSEKE